LLRRTNPPTATICSFCLVACYVLIGSGCQALHPFTEHTKAKLTSARKWANGGLEALQSGHVQRAQGFFKRAAEQRPDDFRNRANLARAHFQAGEHDQAVREMQYAVILSNNDPQMAIELGQMQLAIGDAESARLQVDQVLKADRQFSLAWILLGKINRYQGNLQEALNCLHKAAGFAPENLDIQMELAKTYRANNEPYKALAAIDLLLNRHPNDAQPEQAILSKADILLQLDQTSAAIATLRRANAERSKSEAIATKLVQIQLDAGKAKQADETLKGLRQQFPDSNELRRMAEQLEKSIIR
jgi:tetratricopeptide (TPR) repeat protein